MWTDASVHPRACKGQGLVRPGGGIGALWALERRRPGRHKASKTRMGSQEDAHLAMPDLDHRGAQRIRHPPPSEAIPFQTSGRSRKAFLNTGLT